MNNQVPVCLMAISMVITVSCQSRSKGREQRNDQKSDSPAIEATKPGTENIDNTGIGKVIFFIENSGSMLGYVSKPNEFMNSIVSSNIPSI